MVKSKAETIQALSENVVVGEKTLLLPLFKTFFHSLCLIHFLWSSVYGVSIFLTLTEDQLKEPKIVMMKTYLSCYGTNWNATFQTLFLGLALIHDVLRWLDKHDSKLGNKIKYFRDIIFNGLVFPFTCFVTSMFWAVYLIDRELVFPQVYDQIVPWWLNHCVHTNIFIVICIETLLTRRRHPTDVKVETWMCGFVSVFYAVVYYSIYFFGGCWLYGVFGVMNWWQVCLYQAGVWFSTWIFYNLNFIVNRMIHKKVDTINPKETSKDDLESRETTFQSVSKNGGSKNGIDSSESLKDVEPNIGTKDKNGGSNNGIDSSKSLKDVEPNNGTKDKNGFNDESSGKTNEGFVANDDINSKNLKDWKSIGVNRIDEADEDSLNKPFEKSWSTKYRTSRNQLENSSL